MQTVLDIDLDFFLDRILYNSDEPKGRPDNRHYKVDTIESAFAFLHEQCGLPPKATFPGHCCIHHKEVFFKWKMMICDGILKVPFKVIHIDAHADMGFGNASCTYIAEHFLAKPPEQRKLPLSGGPWAVNNCNFLAYALASRWISHLTYVTHPQYEDDIQWVHMKDFSSTSGFVQMKLFKIGFTHRLSNPLDVKKLPFKAEPDIPLDVISRSQFRTNTLPDFVFISQSPNYSPPAADKLYAQLCKIVKPIG